MRGKRRDIHKRIAEALLELQPEVANTEPAVLAHHTTEAELLEEAIDWWTRAGQAAATRSANPEAIELLERGLSLVVKLPESEARDRRELALQTALFGPLIVVKGQVSAELERAFNRTLELCEQVDAPEEMFRALFAKSLSHALGGQLALSREVANDLLQRAKRASDKGALLMGHRMVGLSLWCSGRLAESQEHLDTVLSTFDDDLHRHVMVTYGQHPAASCEAYNSSLQWVTGWPDKARAASERAIENSLKLGHGGTLGVVLAIVWADYKCDEP